MDLNVLNGAQQAILRKAILAAFTRPELDRLLSDGDRDGIDVIAPQGSFEVQVFEIVELSQRSGWTDWLVAEVVRERPLNSHVKSLMADLERAGAQSTAAVAADAPSPSGRAAAGDRARAPTPAIPANEGSPVVPKPERPLSVVETPPSSPGKAAADPAGTRIGQWMLTLAGILVAFGILGGAIDGVINKWSFAGEIAKWLHLSGPDCDNYSKLMPEEQELCDMQLH